MTKIHKKFEDSFAKFTAVIYDHKYITLVSILLVTAVLISQITKLRIDTRDESLFHEDDPALIAYNEFRDTFGQNDQFIIAMRPYNGLTPEFIATLSKLHNELETSVPYIEDITSLINARIVNAEGDTLIVDDLIRNLPATNAGLDKILNTIDRYPLYNKLIVSEDRSITSILIKARAVKDMAEDDLLEGFESESSPVTRSDEKYLSNEESIEISTAIGNVINGYKEQNIDFYLTGNPAVTAELSISHINDIYRLMPLIFTLTILLLLGLYRRLSGVLYPLIVVFLSLFCTLGIMGFWGFPITPNTSLLPAFIFVVGTADSVHILTIFYRNYRNYRDKRKAIIETMGFSGLPVLMTSVTTACGLFSFAFADLKSVAELGYVAPIGVMLALFYTVVLLPTLICIFPMKPAKPIPEGVKPIADRMFDAISVMTTRRPIPVIVLFVFLLTVAVYGAVSIRFGMNALAWFPTTSPIRISTEMLDKVNGGTVMLEVLVDSERENELKNPDLLHRMNDVSILIPEVEVHGIRAAKAWSISDVLKEINRALNEGRDDAYIVPESRELIAQELMMFESSGSDDLQDFTDTTYQTGRISVLIPYSDAVLYKDYLDEMKSYIKKYFPGESVTMTGHLPLMIQITKNTITSMAKSYIFSIVVITLLMILIIGRIRIGLISMVPNIVPIIGILGLMGIFNISLDLSNILCGSIALGLIVDDTIHFLHHFRRAFEETGNVETSVRMTLHSAGRALVITSMILCSCFFSYINAYLIMNIRTGILIGSAALFALVADLILVPSLLSLIYGKKTVLPTNIIQDANTSFKFL